VHRKLTRLLKILEDLNLDLLILTETPNIEYMLEIELESPTVYIALRRDGTYRVYVSKLDYWRIIDLAHIEPESVIPFSRPGVGETIPGEIPIDKLVDNIVQDNVKRIGIDTIASQLAVKLRDKNVEIVDVQDKILQVRSVKDEREVELISKAIKITERCLEEVLHRVGPGVREVEVEAWLTECITEHEAGLAFKPIVASGINSAYPHHISTSRRIERGDVVVIDVGARYRCYCSDITRTIVVGSPTPDKKEIFEKVLTAQEEAIRKVRPDIEAEEVDKTARTSLGEYSKFFIHSTGHGIGVECHEKPSIAPGEKTRLVKSNVITVEPGVYIRGKFGVRIEDDVLVTDSGVRVLSTFPRNLL